MEKKGTNKVKLKPANGLSTQIIQGLDEGNLTLKVGGQRRSYRIYSWRGIAACHSSEAAFHGNQSLEQLLIIITGLRVNRKPTSVTLGLR